MINTGILTDYDSYTTEDDFVEWTKGDIDEALDNLYLLQNNISLSSLSLIDPHFKLVYNKTVPMFFKDFGSTKKLLKFTLSEATLQLSSSIFTVKFFNLTQFTDD